MKFLKKWSWTFTVHKAAKLYTKLKYDEALEVGKLALEKAEDAFGPKHINVNRSLFNLVIIQRTRKEYHEAVKYGKRAIAITEENRGVDDISLIDDLENLLAVYESMNKEVEVEEIKERIETIKEKQVQH